MEKHKDWTLGRAPVPAKLMVQQLYEKLNVLGVVTCVPVGIKLGFGSCDQCCTDVTDRPRISHASFQQVSVL
jgi:hypothetical protein